MIEDTERVKWWEQNILEYTEEARNRFLIAVIVVAVGLAIDYNMTTNVYIQNCRNPLEIAAEAGTLELAKSRLEKAITGCSGLRNGDGPRGDGWRESLEGQVKALAQVKPTATAQEKYFVLQQFRQTLRNVGERLDKEN